MAQYERVLSAAPHAHVEVFLEETCEIIGVLLFVLALMKLLTMRCKSITAIL